ncbi:MAG: DUF3299 domain-containing protein [Bacteroidota bacterium]|nr:DUF3299 domain-containing protein [Bacteroidota bacterium]
MHKYFIFFLLFISKFSFSQIEITWKELEDVEFSDMYIDSVGESILWPHFGFNVRELDGKEVSLSGYILALDADKGYYVLSKGPFASCFFCGAGGPETVVELSLKSDKYSFYMDEFATIRGFLKLNADDLYRCVYILEDAEVNKR